MLITKHNRIQIVTGYPKSGQILQQKCAINFSFSLPSEFSFQFSSSFCKYFCSVFFVSSGSFSVHITVVTCAHFCSFQYCRLKKQGKYVFTMIRAITTDIMQYFYDKYSAVLEDTYYVSLLTHIYTSSI